MSEYDLVCDVCRKPLEAADAVVSWTADRTTDRDFRLGHTACVPATATARIEVRRLVSPNEFLGFVAERFGRQIADPEPLRAIVWALAPFVVRHDNPAEMDIMRAASFGARPGVKPGADAATSPDKKPVESRGDMHSGK